MSSKNNSKTKSVVLNTKPKKVIVDSDTDESIDEINNKLNKIRIADSDTDESIDEINNKFKKIRITNDSDTEESLKKSLTKESTLKNNDIRNICFEDINEKYSYGKFGGFNVILMKENGYINATKLCQDAMTETGSKKSFREWKRLKDYTYYTSAVSKLEGIPPNLLIIEITNNANLTRGTYVHPKLIPHIASWAI